MWQTSTERIWGEGMRKTTIFSLVTLLVLIPATLFLGTQLRGRWHYLTSTLVILEAMLPFFLVFETRKPQARELVTIAVMAALAVAGRVAIPVPNFKAITGIVMIAGMAFGPQAGFMTGAISAFGLMCRQRVQLYYVIFNLSSVYIILKGKYLLFFLQCV